MGVGGPAEPGGAPPRERVSRKQRSSRERVPHEQRPIPEPMSTRNIAIFAAFIGVLYAVGMIGRGEIAPGLVGGTLAAILAFLVFREVGNRQRRRIAEREKLRRERGY